MGVALEGCMLGRALAYRSFIGVVPFLIGRRVASLGDYEAGHDCEKRANGDQGEESAAKVGISHSDSY